MSNLMAYFLWITPYTMMGYTVSTTVKVDTRINY